VLQNGVTRVKNREIVVPIRVGTVSWHLGKNAKDHATHKWTAYFRHADNEDITDIVKKVVFKLHESFADPTRDLYSGPYEVTEQGWGEFNIMVQIYFVDETRFEGPLEIVHSLKLYHTDPNKTGPVATETFEEVVIPEPTEALWKRFLGRKIMYAPKTEISEFVVKGDDVDELGAIMLARQKVALLTAKYC